MTYIIILVLIIFSALFSGLTLGLMSLNVQELKRKMSLGDKDAKRVYGVRKNGNLLLCTLLIGNVAVNSALAIFLGSLASGFVAALLATGLIVVFGEITPQAIFSRFALSLGAKMAGFVRLLIFILYPICWPISLVLDKTLGDELPTIYSKRELMKIIEEHEDSPKSDVKAEEERIVKGALTFSDKKVQEIMTPKSAVVMLESLTKLDKGTLESISGSGHSRIPVYRGRTDNVIGILYIRDLLGDKNVGKEAGQVCDKKVFFVDEDKKLASVFNAFLRTKHHLFVVSNQFGSVVGVVTLEDILEEIIRAEIMDENDRHKDLRKFAKVLKKRKMI